ncbi:MAG: CGNR zinc finger domain-containing protein [Nocardioides sp.]
MKLAHDTEVVLISAVALANSAEPDTLTTIADLDEFFAEHSYSGRHDRTAQEFEQVRAIRQPLAELLRAEADQQVALVNAVFRTHGAMPQLIRHDGWDWHLHLVDHDRPLATRILVESALAIVDLLRADELSRLATCAAAGCDDLLVDLSRNRSRRFCSVACGNREAVAAFRARKRDPGVPDTN